MHTSQHIGDEIQTTDGGSEKIFDSIFGGGGTGADGMTGMGEQGGGGGSGSFLNIDSDQNAQANSGWTPTSVFPNWGNNSDGFFGSVFAPGGLATDTTGGGLGVVLGVALIGVAVVGTVMWIVGRSMKQKVVVKTKKK